MLCLAYSLFVYDLAYVSKSADYWVIWPWSWQIISKIGLCSDLLHECWHHTTTLHFTFLDTSITGTHLNILTALLPLIVRNEDHDSISETLFSMLMLCVHWYSSFVDHFWFLDHSWPSEAHLPYFLSINGPCIFVRRYCILCPSCVANQIYREWLAEFSCCGLLYTLDFLSSIGVGVSTRSNFLCHMLCPTLIWASQTLCDVSKWLFIVQYISASASAYNRYPIMQTVDIGCLLPPKTPSTSGLLHYSRFISFLFALHVTRDTDRNINHDDHSPISGSKLTSRWKMQISDVTPSKGSRIDTGIGVAITMGCMYTTQHARLCTW